MCKWHPYESMDALCLNLALWSANILPTFLLIDFVEPLETSVLSKSAFRRMRVPSMAIRRLNTTIQPMNDKLGTLVSADLPSGIYCLLFRSTRPSASMRTGSPPTAMTCSPERSHPLWTDGLKSWRKISPRCPSTMRWNWTC